MRASDTSGLKGFPVEAHSADRDAGKVAAESSKGFGILVNHRNRVPSLVEATCKQGTDPAAAHDDDVHAASLHPWLAAPDLIKLVRV
jgi:hypothetical protein